MNVPVFCAWLSILLEWLVLLVPWTIAILMALAVAVCVWAAVD